MGTPQVPPLQDCPTPHETTLAQVVPQVASAFRAVSHPFGAAPSQFIVPATHGAQAPPLQVCVFAAHGEAAPHCPPDEHVWTPFPEHCFVPGTQTPVQAPPTHADDTHCVGAPHWPLASQVMIPLVEHPVESGVQTPMHAPFAHAWFAHVTPSCHARETSHVCTIRPLHWVVPGVHVPVHSPALQSVAQGVPSTQLPVGSQV